MIKVRGEAGAKELLSKFVCSKDPDVMNYLKNTACEHEKKEISRTYLFVDNYNNLKILAYISLAIKCMRADKISKSNDIYDFMNINRGVAQSYLIGQLAKADGEPKGMAPILIDTAMSYLKMANEVTGCRIARLDCQEPLKKIYEENGFISVGYNSDNSLCQMIRVL